MDGHSSSRATGVRSLLATALAVAMLTGTQAFAADGDRDGVADADDNCPRLPNARRSDGTQPRVCGGLSKSERAQFVYLQSRTFARANGVDDRIRGTGERRHVFLHVARDGGHVVLDATRRAALARAGVWLGDYLPHDTFYASVPSDAASLARIAALPSVQGLSAIESDDRLARDLRALQGSDDAHYEITFFADVPQPRIGAELARLGLESSQADGTTRLVEIRDYDDVIALSRVDIVEFIDAAEDEIVTRDEASDALIQAGIVERVLGLDGAGLTVGMAETHSLPVPPEQHPDMTQRTVKDSFDTSQFTGHNLEVAGLLMGDGSLTAANAGLLPEAVLFTYGSAAFPSTSLHTYFDFVRQAREHGDAAVFNYSIGPRENCNRLGAYRKQGRHLDRAVHEIGMVVSFAAGNTRGAGGTLAVTGDDPTTDDKEKPPKNGPCRSDGVDNLPHPVPKNPLMVGNWDGVFGQIAGSSAVGPAEDGRLKPDLVAPGTSIQTTTFDEDTGSFGYRSFSGTSAAAPVLGGVAGQVLEAMSLATVPRTPTDVPPASVKAILAHTARDVGPFGPDHIHGYGLVDAAEAARVALAHSEYLHEASVGESAPDNIHGFDVDGTVYGFKVTLAWDDVPAARSATETLVNDLDLTVVDPSGNVYYPFDTSVSSVSASARLAEVQAGARLCDVNDSSCADHVNNIEQVLVLSADGQPLPTGPWAVHVDAHDVASGDQPFSVVVTPDACPLRIYADTTLGEDVECPDLNVDPVEPLAPASVIIEYDDVTLDCADHVIRGAGPGDPEYAGTHVGIHSSRDRIAIRNCVVEGFDTGIELVGSDTSVVAASEVQDTATAVLLDGDNADGITTSVVTTTTIGSTIDYGVRALGNVDASLITANPMSNASAGEAAIAIEATDLRRPDNNTVAFNIIGGSHTGVSVEGDRGDGEGTELRPFNTLVFGNFVDSETTIGVNEVLAENSQIFGNFLYPTHIGVQSVESLGRDAGRHIQQNAIVGASFGVAVLGNSAGRVKGNIITSADVGIMVSLKRDDRAAIVGTRFVNVEEGNTIEFDANGTGIYVVASENVRVTDNTAVNGDFDPNFPTAFSGSGVVVADSDDVSLTDNEVRDAATGYSIANTSGASAFGNVATNVLTGISVTASHGMPVMGNTVNDAQRVGIVVAADDVALDSNGVAYSTGIVPPPLPTAAIHYAEGARGRIEENRLVADEPVENAIRVGEFNLFGGGGFVTELEISEQSASGFDVGIELRRSTRSVTIRDTAMTATGTGLRANSAGQLDWLDVGCSRFEGGTLDVDVSAPIEMAGNVWTEIEDGTLDITDSDGDGVADSGTDHVFSSTDYTGAAASAALTSTRTSQVADPAPWTGPLEDCEL